MTAEPVPPQPGRSPGRMGDAFSEPLAADELRARIQDGPEPEAASAGRRGRGSLAGAIEQADDWDSAAINAEIARDFER